MWGEIEHFHVLPKHAVAFVRFVHRPNAEMARIALADQPLGNAPMLNVRWAYEDKNPREMKRQRTERKTEVEGAMERRLSGMGLTETEVATVQLMQMARNQGEVTAPYPRSSGPTEVDVDESFPPKPPNFTLIPMPSVEIPLPLPPLPPGPPPLPPVSGEEVADNLMRMNDLLARISAVQTHFET